MLSELSQSSTQRGPNSALSIPQGEGLSHVEGGESSFPFSVTSYRGGEDRRVPLAAFSDEILSQLRTDPEASTAVWDPPSAGRPTPATTAAIEETIGSNLELGVAV